MSKTMQFVEVKVNDAKKKLTESMFEIDKDKNIQNTINTTIKINEAIELLAKQFEDKIIKANFGSRKLFDKIIQMELIENEINKIKSDTTSKYSKSKCVFKNKKSKSKKNKIDEIDDELKSNSEILKKKIQEHEVIRKEISKLIKNRKKRVKKKKKQLKKSK